MAHITIGLAVIGVIINLGAVVTFFIILERRLTKIETIQERVFNAQIKALFSKFEDLDKTLKIILSRSDRHRMDYKQ